MAEDTKYVLRDIQEIRPHSTGEYIVYYMDGRSDSFRTAVMFDKGKLPAGTTVLVEYKKICDTYRFVGLAKVEKLIAGRPVKFSQTLENTLSFGGPLILPEKTVRIINERTRLT